MNKYLKGGTKRAAILVPLLVAFITELLTNMLTEWISFGKSIKDLEWDSSEQVRWAQKRVNKRAALISKTGVKAKATKIRKA